MRVLRMCKRPVNSLSLEMLESLAKDLNEAESDPECRAVVLASAVPGIFSAGLDIEEVAWRPCVSRVTCCVLLVWCVLGMPYAHCMHGACMLHACSMHAACNTYAFTLQYVAFTLH